MAKQLMIERKGTIATVTLNRPRKLNALTKGLWKNIATEFRALAADDTLRCIVIRGAGDQAFSPGNDVREFEKHRANVDQARTYGKIMGEAIEALAACPHPMVALIEGICVGGGLEIATLCDIRICGESSRFGIPINRLGLVMSHVELRGLIDLVGRATALEILLEGRIFGADEARAKGLVTRIAPDDEVVSEAYRAAQRIAAGAPLAARWHKQFARRLADPTPLSDAERDTGYACFGTRDYQIGYQAFLAKKKPRFAGK